MSHHPFSPPPPGPAASRSPGLSMDRGGWSGSSFLALVGDVIVTPWATATAATGLLSIYSVLDTQLRNAHASPRLILPEAPGGMCEHPSLTCVRSVARSRPTLCDPIDCSPPGSSVLGILQARMLGGVVISSSRSSSQPNDQTHVSSSS